MVFMTGYFLFEETFDPQKMLTYQKKSKKHIYGVKTEIDQRKSYICKPN
jgi:hypothetical protein